MGSDRPRDDCISCIYSEPFSFFTFFIIKFNFAQLKGHDLIAQPIFNCIYCPLAVYCQMVSHSKRSDITNKKMYMHIMASTKIVYTQNCTNVYTQN